LIERKTIDQGLKLDHGAIGNGRVIALISPSTSIDWLCLPRFDSPSVFGRLLDEKKGGSFSFEMVGGGVITRMEYITNTNVLCTHVSGDEGAFDVYDYAPRIPSGLTVQAPLEIHRLLVPRTGNPGVRIHFNPAPDYARARAEFVQVDGGIEVAGGPFRYYLATNAPVPYVLNGRPVHLDRGLYFAFSLGKPSELDSMAAGQRGLELTIQGWRQWAKTCALPQFAAAEVLRSALCLKLHASVDTGAVIAAATTSIPEAVGTERTWDYRYCWLRDAAFVVEGLRRLSHLAEGEAFVNFVRNVAEEGPLQPVYGIGGERELPELHLDHLSGFAGGRPVRIGNAAYQQKQNDLMGETILCLESLFLDPRLVTEDPAPLIKLVERLVTDAIAASPTTDTGIWEFRTNLRHYTFSGALCWVAARRGARLARRFGRLDLAERWEEWAEVDHVRLLREAYSEKVGCFTQALNGQYPDAANLLLPTLGFIDARDPKFVSTVRTYEKTLVDKGLMLRYRNPDDFGETTSAFSICSFWWAEALAMMGELDKAIEVFNRIVSYANPVGLFSEDIEPGTGRLVGNFPQAYTHVGLIHAAITIGELLEARDGKFRAWG
jgi:GH15 family glucan-1,4-alpha-glucosidase